MALECGHHWAYRDDLCCTAFWYPVGTRFSCGHLPRLFVTRGLRLQPDSWGGLKVFASLAIYSTVSFVVVSVVMGLLVGDGSFANTGNPNLEFLLRAWRWPDTADLGQIAAIGVLSAVIAVRDVCGLPRRRSIFSGTVRIRQFASRFVVGVSNLW